MQISAFQSLLLQIEKFATERIQTASRKELEWNLQHLKKEYDAFLQYQLIIESQDEEQDKMAVHEATRSMVNNIYFAIGPALEQQLDSINSIKAKEHTVPHQLPNPKLPEIRLETFSGDVMRWAEFIQSFDSMIHNQVGINDITKLQYLKGALTGRAALVLQNLDVSAENYNVARELLTERFENKKLICEEHIKALFDYQPIQKACAESLNDLLNHFTSHLRSLTTYDRRVDTWDDLLVFLIASKFDSETRLKWIDKAPLKNLATFIDISEFIQIRCLKLESQSSVNNGSQKPNVSTSVKPPPFKSLQFKSPSFKSKPSNTGSFQVKVNSTTCNYCNSTEHYILKCASFKGLQVNQRRSFAETAPLCFNCLGKDHTVATCPNKGVCYVCQNKHHSLLHRDNTPTPAVTTTAQVHTATIFKASPVQQPYVLLATALVNVVDHVGTTHVARAFLDSGSQRECITEEFFLRLGVTAKPCHEVIYGIGNRKVSCSQQTTLQIRSRTSAFSEDINFVIMPMITGLLPTIQIDRSAFAIPKNIMLADPNFHVPNNIDLILGAKYFFQTLLVGQIRTSASLPILQNTVFGWICSGNIDSLDHQNNQPAESALYFMGNQSLEQQIERFWTIETIPEGTKCVSTFDHVADKHFVSTHIRDEDGRFVVRLPFAEDPRTLGDSSQMALKRFYNLEKRLARNPELRQLYTQFMADYKSMNHMQSVSNDDIQPNNFYFPHHCILKPDSSTTKLRTVFDGSAKTTSGKSLNEILMVGPVVQNDLLFILSRFRSHAYAFSCDVSKMYRQILLHDDDTKYHYIFWREDPNSSLETFKLKTVTYGTSAAPFLATRCLFQLALENEDTSPQTASSIRHDFYVDDLLTGANTLSKVVHLKNDIVNILASAKLELRKWCSNVPSVIDDIPEDDREPFLDMDDDNFVKTLGVLWQPTKDIFRFKVLTTPTTRITKRIILSEVARIFDPLGLLSPVVVLGKLFMQRLWQLKSDWDQSLPMHYHTYWQNFRDELHQLEQFSFPRHLFDGMEEPSHIQLHGFADASQKAYGATIYTRVLKSDGTYIMRLMCAKSRVAPLQTTTLARLELCASLLLSELMDKLVLHLNFKIDAIFYWSDSTIALHWIYGDPYHWNTFVANRVATIQRITNRFSWYHVESASNPADIVSRGLMPSEFVNCNVWKNGPQFLHEADENWINNTFHVNNQIDVPERKKTAVVFLAVDPSSENTIFHGMKYRFNYEKLIITMSYVSRFLRNVSLPRDKRLFHPMTSEDYTAGLMLIARFIQIEAFGDQIQHLKKHGTVRKCSHLKSLTPFLDDNGVMRVGGRLQHSMLAYESKHPIIMPSDHPFTSVMFRHFHRKHLHVGPKALLSIVRETFWPVYGLKLAKTTIKNCVRCVRVKPALQSQQMGILPAERVRVSCPFNCVSIDFCGPLHVHYKKRGTTPTKAYIAVFVCLSTKAIHLEVAANLTTLSFLGAFRRFVGTRGLPSKVYSDNGLNFVGANSDLQELYQLLQSSHLSNEIKSMCRNDSIDWHFFPPGSPHFGGLHEAAVKSTKYHLRRVIGNANLTYEELSTLIKQVEGCLNSRPLMPLTSNVEDLNALTPGHFLIGRPLVSVPEPSVEDQNQNLLTRFALVQALLQHFWKHWSKDYLQTLQQRKKWFDKHPNIKIHDLVLLKDENLPPLKWKTGRITELHPGNDGLVRVVTVKTTTGTYKRSITKVCLLPIGIEPQTVQGGENVEP